MNRPTKRCVDCRRDVPVEEYFVMRSGPKAGYVWPCCRPCQVQRQLRSVAKRRARAEEMLP